MKSAPVTFIRLPAISVRRTPKRFTAIATTGPGSPDMMM